jgi:hypothetical protein
MTVSTTARKQTFTLDEATADFTFTFRALPSAPTDIKCLTTTVGTETILVYTTDYTVAVNASGVGGVLTLVSPATEGLGTLTVYRETTNTQASDYDDYNQFPADTLENDLDIRTLISQEAEETSDRALTLPISVSSSVSTIVATPVALKVIGWDATGLVLTQYDQSSAQVTAAQTAQAAAELAQTAAETAQTNAETAETNAETAETNAETAETNAEAAQVAAESAAATLATVVTLSTGTLVPLNASLGYMFTLTSTASTTILAPSPTGGTGRIVIRFYADSGARTLTLTGGSLGFRFGSTITALTETASGKYDYIGAIYNLADTIWDVVAVSKGL